MNFSPHTTEDVRSMLNFLGLDDLSDLYGHIPKELLFHGKLNLPDGLSEFDAKTHILEISGKNLQHGNTLVCFAGGGSYDHDISAATNSLASRSEFVTAYTPYQPEVAQGVLQALFEFQTLVTRLTALDVSNASLYDGASSLVEAVNLATSHAKKERVLLSAGIHPNWRQVVETFAIGTGHQVETLPLRNGITDLSDVDMTNVAAIAVASPNALGFLERIDNLANTAKENKALLIQVFDPIAASVLKSPGASGADIAVGEGQSLGMPLSYGGPYLGLFAVKSEYVRLIPGRLVGETVDKLGRKAYVTTLRSREQDIRREKASSNVCTNQTLIAIRAAIQMSWLGTNGIKEVAKISASSAHYLANQLVQAGFALAYDSPFLYEFSIKIKIDPEEVVEAVCYEGMLPGIARYPHEIPGISSNLLTIATTEKRTKDEMDRLVSILKKIAL